MLARFKPKLSTEEQVEEEVSSEWRERIKKFVMQRGRGEDCVMINGVAGKIDNYFVTVDY